MMKKLMVSSVVLSTLSLLGAQVVQAESVSNNATSNATVQFQENNTPTPPPPGPDPDPNPPSVDGPLTIDAISNFKFGTENELESKAKSYDIVFDDTDYINGEQKEAVIQVTDHRGGVPKGWTVTVQGDALSADGYSSIKGATISIRGAKVAAAENTDATDNTPTVVSDLDINLGDTAGDTAASQLIMQAQEGTGFGTWRDWFGTDIQLNMPSNNHAETNVSYAAVLTWTISDTPGK